MHCCFFADDMTLSISGDDLAKTVEVFSRKLMQFLDWVKYRSIRKFYSERSIPFNCLSCRHVIIRDMVFKSIYLIEINS